MPLGSEVVAEIVDRTDGVPLFARGIDQGSDRTHRPARSGCGDLVGEPQPALALPTTLHASLVARLTGLARRRARSHRSAQCWGREFAHELIEAVAQHRGAELQASLDLLVEAGLLSCRGAPPRASYLFKHALVQDAAYSTLLRRRQGELHGRIADVLRDEFGEIAKARPEILARHYTEGGQVQNSVVYWQRPAARRPTKQR